MTYMRFPMPVLFLTALLVFSCQIEKSDITSGCKSDSDCRDGRVCLERICTYPYEAELLEPASETARKLFLSLSYGSVPNFKSLWMIDEDYDWGFDLGGSSDDPGEREENRDMIIEQLEDELLEDFSKILEERDFEGAEYVRFEPGSYAPIPKGRERAIMPLDRLKASRIVYQKEGREKKLAVAQLIRLRGRWRLFRLSE